MRRTLVITITVGVWAATAHGAPFAYVPNSVDNTVSVIDTASDVVVDTIPVPGVGLRTAAVSADGFRVYVGDLNGVNGKIHVIDAETNSVTTSVSVFSGLFQLAISPDGAYVYGAGGASVKVVSTATNSLVLPFISNATTPNPLAVAFHPTLPLAYAVGPFTQDAMVIDTSTRTVITPLGIGNTDVLVHPDGTRAYSLLTCTACFPPPGITAFDTATNLQIPFSSIATTGDQPRAMETDPTGALIWVTTHDTILGALVSKIDTVGGVELAAEPVGTEIWGIVLHPDGTRLYVVDRGGDAVHVVDPATLAVTNTIAVGDGPFARGQFIGPIATCGDGELTFPEDCDDGNLDDGDCCSSTCEIEEGMPCDDGDACTDADTCDADAVCVGGPPPSCDDGDLCTQDSCDSGIGCINDASPRSGCREAAKSILQIKDKSDDTKDKLSWVWIKGDAVDLAELADPTQDTDFALCLYAGTAAGLVTDYAVTPGAAWKAVAKGFKYKDKTGASDGVQKVLLKSGVDTKSKALVKGKGDGLKDFDLTLLQEPVVAQLVSDETASSGICWNATYDAQTFIKNEADLFKAKAQN